MAKQRVTTDEPRSFPDDITPKNSKQLHIIHNKRAAQYEESFVTKEAESNPNLAIKSVPELFKKLADPTNKNIDIDARVIVAEKGTGKFTVKKMNRNQFVEAYKSNANKKVFREGLDFFAMDMDVPSNQVGRDYIPLLGGPFNKQLYIQDYLKMHTTAFHAWNHDPIAKAYCNIMRDFVIGRGFRVDCKDPRGLAIWNAFAEVNDLGTLMDQFTIELGMYGEQMIWWLPNHDTKITYQLGPNQKPPKGILPRIRLVDPSVIWDIITYPEDISRVLAYQWVAPTQYQMYTKADSGEQVPGTKFIFQQIPGADIDHYKVNCVSNEKRGRSDLFPVLGYMKRLRDSVNYSIIGLQKSTAWSLDTSIDGNQADIDSYIKAQESLGTIPPPGSEFVHSKKVERKYLSNEGSAKGQQSTAFDWAFSMIAAGLGMPVTYFGTHLGHQTNRASAVVATEPVTKRFEARRLIIERALQKMAKRLFEPYGIDADIEVTFPELISQDRSAKMKDLAMAVSMGWVSNERAAEIAAKELDITKFDWESERETIDKEKAADEIPALIPGTIQPLTAPGSVQPGQSPVKPTADNADAQAKPDPNSAMTSDQKRDVRVSRGF